MQPLTVSILIIYFMVGCGFYSAATIHLKQIEEFIPRGYLFFLSAFWPALIGVILYDDFYMAMTAISEEKPNDT